MQDLSLHEPASIEYQINIQINGVPAIVYRYFQIIHDIFN